MAGGDNYQIRIEVGRGANLTVTTAAAEKVYRSLGPDTEVGVKLEIAEGGTLAWLPQETILFNRVQLCRSIDIQLAPNANLLFAEAVIFGRSAMGEKLREGKFVDRWRVKVGADLVFAENVRLTGAIARSLSESAVAKDAVAIASVLMIPGRQDDIAAIRAKAANFSGEVGASAWNGLAAMRFVAPSGAALHRDLITALAVLRAAPPPRLWLN